MKNNLFVIISLMLLNFNNGRAQALPDSVKLRILQTLEYDGFVIPPDSKNWIKIWNAIDTVKDFQIAEAIPLIESRIWSSGDNLMRDHILSTLFDMKDPGLVNLSKAIIDTAENILVGAPRKNEYYFAYPKSSRHTAIYYLFKLGDYSYADTFWVYARECGGIDKIPSGIFMAGLLAKNEATHRDSIKTELLRIMYSDTSANGYYRGFAAHVLWESLGSESLGDLMTFFTTTIDLSGTNPFIAHEISMSKNPQFESSLKSKILQNCETFNKSFYLNLLLKHYSTSVNYQFVKTYISLEQDQIVRLEAQYLFYTFIPDTPSVTMSISELIDTLDKYRNECHTLNWLGDQSFVTELNGYLANAHNTLNAGNQIDCARQIKTFQQAVDREYKDSTNATPAFVTVEGWKFLYYNAQYILDRLPQIPPSGCNVKLVNSVGIKLTGGSLQYYEGSWKDGVNNNDGTFFVNTTKTTLSLRMIYENGTQTKSNVTVGNDTVAFQTINAQIQLQNSSGALIDTGSVQYYAGAWRNLGTTINGTATKELLPNTYSFRMTYAYASKDKQQDIGTNPTVIFQTVNAAVQLQNSRGALMDQGTVQYYSGAWRDLGTTTNGVANKELLPNNYSFRMTYAYASKDKQQDIGTNATVVFQTVNAAVQLKNSLGNLIDQGTVQYYSGAWRDLGTTTNGIVNKELLPNNYSFRMTYAYASKDKQQDIGTNAIVIFQTVNAAVQLKNSLGNLIDQGTVQYYSGAWRDLGTTTNGIANKELLPNNYSFRMTYSYASKDKQQDISTNAIVVFQTVNAAVQLQNSQGALIDQGTVQYYSGAWRTLGTTTNGTATKELLPNSYSFRMTYEYVSVDKAQDISTNNTVSFSTVLCTIRVRNMLGQVVNDAQASYYSGAWRQIGNTVNGEVTKELLPVNLSFRVKYGTQQQDKQQNLSSNNVVEFVIQ